MQQLKTSEPHIADRDILRGPPGLLFGLTLLIFAAARLCFGWDSQPSDQEAPVPAQVAANTSDQELSSPLTHAAYID